MYAALIWFPYGSPFLIQKLLIIKNSTLSIATASFKLTCMNHLHEETKMLSVQYCLFLISSQYLARALQPNNPSRSVVTSTLHIRDQKKKPFNPCFSIVLLRIYQAVFYPPLIIGPPSTIKLLHTKAFLSFLTHNRVLRTAFRQTDFY